MRIEVLENVKLLYQNESKQIWMVYHPIEQHYFIKKILYGHFNVEIYETLKKHPHIGFANVYEVEKNEHELIVIEEFVNGCTLEYEMGDQVLHRNIVIQYILELLDVLQHLHSLTPPIIHRDIKPANIMICANHIKLIDFDIAREFEQGQRKDTMVMGSVGYAAPEQYGFTQSDPRTDIYAMGILINEMLINRHPQEEMVIGKVAEVIKTCTHIDPNRRYKNIAELRIAFSKAMSVVPNAYPIEKTKIKKQDYFFHIGVLAFAVFYFTSIKDMYTWMDKINQTLTVVSFFYFGYWIVKNKWHLQEATPLYKAKYKGIRFINGLLIWFGCIFLFMFTLVLLNEVVTSMLAAYQILLK